MIVNDASTNYNETITRVSKNTNNAKNWGPQISNDFAYVNLMDIQEHAHKSLQDKNKGLDSTPAEADKKAWLL